MLVSIHNKSDYSLGFGTISPEELAEKAASLGYRAVALTDLESLAGQVRFHARCRSLGIRPITGLEFRPGYRLKRSAGTREGRVVLLARDSKGYRNLCRILSRRADSGIIDLAARHSGGLFALSDDPLVIQELLSSGSFERTALGLLLIRPAIDEGHEKIVLESAKRLDIPLVASMDTVFLSREDYPVHLLQSAIRLNRKISELTADQVSDAERWLRSTAGASELFPDIPEAVARAERIADECAFDLTSQPAPMPDLDLLTGRSAEKRLAELCGRSIKDRLRDGTWTPLHAARIEEELTVFSSLGVSSCFLAIAEIVDYCREHGIPIAARGSAVSSLALHLLGASCVNPVDEGLFFERFLHAEKTSWPDVDLDLPSNRRDEVIEWVYDRFGRERVAMVAAHQRFQLRSALREGFKALGVSPARVKRLMQAVPPDDLQSEEVDFSRVCLPREIRDLLPLVQRLVGRPRNIALHPGGVLIGHDRLEDMLPLERASKGVVITQFDAADIEALGLFKIDLLGNRCLSEIEETLRLAGNTHPGRIEEIPAGDAKTLDLIGRAETVGCFQLESPAMRSLLARLPVRNQGDIVAALALIRPGAAAGNAKARFLHQAERGLDHDVLLFEEEIMVLLSRAGKLSLAESDRLRSAIVESGGDKTILEQLKREFLAGAGQDGENAWAAAERFAAYSFNKAHAASYGRLAYLSAYMKAHYPLEFTCALLNHHQGLYPLRTIAAEMVRRGVAIFPPHVNFSELASRPEWPASENEKGVRIGLDQVKVVSSRTAARILNERSEKGFFKDFPDLLGRVPIPAGELAALVLSGACDGLAPLDSGGYPFVHEAVLQKEKVSLKPPVDENELRSRMLFQGLARVMNELRYLEMHVTAHPIALLRPEAHRYGCVPIGGTVLKEDGSRVRMAAMLAAMRRVPTERGIIQFMTLEDETGLLEAIVLPSVYRTFRSRVTTPGPYLVEARIKREQGAIHCEIVSLTPFYQRPDPFSEQRRSF